MSLKEKAKQLKTNVPAVFIALKKKETPFWAKFFAVLTIAYALSPIDLIPDFIPFLGYLDDVIILPFLIFLTLKFISPELFHQCQIEAEGMWNNGKPKHWYYAIPIILIWVLVLLFVIKAIVTKVSGSQ